MRSLSYLIFQPKSGSIYMEVEQIYIYIFLRSKTSMHIFKLEKDMSLDVAKKFSNFFARLEILA